MGRGVTIEGLSARGQVLYGTNVTTATITLPTQSITPPTTGTINWGLDGDASASVLKIMFFGVGSDTNTGLANVYGWEEVVDQTAPASGFTWIPTLLAAFSFELDSGQPGVANSIIPATNFWATTITTVTGNAGVNLDVISPGHGKDIAHAWIMTKGARKIQVLFGLNSSSTSLNCYIKRA
jgi:hypothetical protein